MEEAAPLLAQARAAFGVDSTEARDAQEVAQFWKSRWAAEGSPIRTAPPDILRERIKDAQRAMRRAQRAS